MPQIPDPSDASLPTGLAEPAFDPNALRVLKERYFARKANGETENAKEFVWRVASSIAKPERPYAQASGRDPDAVVSGVAHAFYEMMARRDFMPNTPCLVNAGRPLSMLSACFVLPVPDSIDGIFYNLKAMALIQKSGGGCIAGDARVWSTFCGIEPIDVLFARTTADGRTGVPHGNGIAYDITDLNVRTLSMDPKSGASGLRQATHIWKFDVPAEKQLVVRTREGVEIQTSEWHPFMVLRGTALEEARADDVRPGDIILGPEKPDAYWPWSEYRTINGLTLDEETAWLVGFTLGDGSFGRWTAGRKRLRWFSGTDDVLHRVRDVLARHGVLVKTISRDPRGETRYVTTLNQGFIEAFMGLCGIGEPGPKDCTIRIPEMIGKSPLSVVRAFLAGLVDSDGNVDTDGSVSYTTASHEMALDLSALMSLLGFQPTVRKKLPHGRGKHPTYTVLLTRINRVNELAATVASYMACESRKTRLRASSAREMRQLKMPFAVWRNLLVTHGLARPKARTSLVGPGLHREELSRWSCNPNGRVRRADLETIAANLAPYEPETAALLTRVARVGHEVASVTRAAKPKPFFDLTVEGWNTYAAGCNGLAMIHNTGFSFSELRPNGAFVQSTGKDASGPVSFMKVFNAATDSIKQGGVRRGANMGVLRVDHPDVFHFMRCKKELDAENNALYNRLSDSAQYSAAQLKQIKQELLQTQINNFNISIGVTDAFMTAVENGSDFDLIDPLTKHVVKIVPAREIWDAIIEGAWQNGEPGVLFLDHPEWNPLPGLGPIQATNPCVTADTMVNTTEGQRPVWQLVGRQFMAIVDGEQHVSTERGFFFTGLKMVYEIETDEGPSLRATADHEILIVDKNGAERWTTVGNLRLGDRLALHRRVKQYAGTGTTQDVPQPRPFATLTSSRLAGRQLVFDCEIPSVHAFDANGFYVHNCGEQALHGYDSCNLGSINVGHFYDSSAKDVDWERLAQTTALAIRFLDNVIDANLYPMAEIEEMVRNNRRVGLGIMGFADLLIQLGIAYGSPASVTFSEKLMKFLRERAEETSEQLARERGEFPNKHLSVWADDPRPRRNAALLSIAPTGTISMIAGCSFGCEPYFGMAYTKHVMKDSEGRPQHLYYVVPLFEEIAKDEGFYSEELLSKIEVNRGSLKGLSEVPTVWQDVFTVAADVSVDQHIDMLAACQKWTCNAVSKTINAPNDDTRENVSRAIFRAYKAGCKGFTYYRDGSRTEQVVTFSKDGDIKDGNRDVAATLVDLDVEALLAKANALLEVR